MLWVSIVMCKITGFLHRRQIVAAILWVGVVMCKIRGFLQRRQSVAAILWVGVVMCKIGGFFAGETEHCHTVGGCSYV